MVQKSHPAPADVGMYKKPLKKYLGISSLHQLVSSISEPSTVWWFGGIFGSFPFSILWRTVFLMSSCEDFFWVLFWRKLATSKTWFSKTNLCLKNLFYHNVSKKSIEKRMFYKNVCSLFQTWKRIPIFKSRVKKWQEYKHWGSTTHT